MGLILQQHFRYRPWRVRVRLVLLSLAVLQAPTWGDLSQEPGAMPAEGKEKDERGRTKPLKSLQVTLVKGHPRKSADWP